MMSQDEKYKLYCRIMEAEEKGDFKKAEEIQKQIPLSYKSAMAAKEVWGSDFLKNSDLNLSEAEEAYGKNWLD